MNCRLAVTPETEAEAELLEEVNKGEAEVRACTGPSVLPHLQSTPQTDLTHTKPHQTSMAAGGAVDGTNRMISLHLLHMIDILVN